MSTNDFKPFASNTGANVITQVDYASSAYDTLRGNGFTTGVAESTKLNKVWRQATFVAAAIGEVIKDSGQDALDDGNLATFVTKLKTAISGLISGGTEDAKWDAMPIGVPVPFVESVVGVSISTWLTAHPKWALLSATVSGSADKAIVVAGTHTAETTFGSADAIAVSHTHTIADHNHAYQDAYYIESGNSGLAISGIIDSGGSTYYGSLSSDSDNQYLYYRDATSANATGLSTASSGSSGTDANYQPSIALIWVIKTS